MTEAVQKKAPLEDLMAAMDVVDTLRHQQGIAERELDGEGRRARLLERLRDMYQGQGIEVPDHVLEEGIDALEQERFLYQSPAVSWRTRVAHAWVSRGRWGKPIAFLSVLAGLLYAVYFVVDVLPERQLRAELPQQIALSLSAITELAKSNEVIERANASASQAAFAIEAGDYQSAESIAENLASVKAQLAQSYSIRVISRANANSGVWRRPPGNPDGRNYYLIVEAIDDNNNVVELTVVNQEDNRIERKKAWGLRVDEDTFYKIAADKKDDGIIQDNRVGEKRLGYLKPNFFIATTGATITEW